MTLILQSLQGSSKTPQRSSQAEIDSFIEASWETTPEPEPVAEIESPALMLPSPDSCEPDGAQ